MTRMVHRGLGLPVVSLSIPALSVLAVCDLVLLTPTSNVLQSWAAVGLAVLLPGWLLVQWFVGQPKEGALGEWFVYSIGAGFGLLVTLMLALSYLPGGLSFLQVAGSFNALVIVLVIGNAFAYRSSPPTLLTWQLSSLDWQFLALAVLLIGAAFLRFSHIAYSELHGDEALVALPRPT